MNDLTKIIPAPKLSNQALKDMFDYRLRRLRKSMTEKNVSLSILVSHVSLRYAIDFDEFQIFQSHIPTCYLFVPAEGPLVMHGASRHDFPNVSEYRRPNFISPFDSGFDLNNSVKTFSDEVDSFMKDYGHNNSIAIERITPLATQLLQNLQDHLDTMVTIRSQKAESIGVSWKSLLPDVITAPFKYYFNKMGWWTSNYIEAGGFAQTKYANKDYPDVQFHFTTIYRSHRGKRFEFGHGYSLFTCLLRPHSTGSIKLNRDGSKFKLLIDHNFLSDPRDEIIIIEAVKKAREVLLSTEFDEVRGKEMAPGKAVQSDQEILEYIRRTALTVYHPVGTCKMGIDELAVVSPENLKVKGMNNLRVVDASIMPTIVSGNTSAPTMMIAEIGSKMILNKSYSKIDFEDFD